MSYIGMNERVMVEMKKILYEEVVPKLNKLELEIDKLKSKKPEQKSEVKSSESKRSKK